MKGLRFIILLLVLVLALTFTPACGAKEPEVKEELAVEEATAIEEPEVTEEPAIEEDADAESEEEPTVEEQIAAGEPELVWSVPHDNTLNSIAVSVDGEAVVVGEFKVSYVHLLADGSLNGVIVYEHAVEDLDFSPDGSALGAGLGLHGVSLTGFEDGSEIKPLGDGSNNRLAFSPDGVHIATGNRDGVVWLWRFDDGEQAATLERPEAGWIQAIDYHPSGSLLAVTHFDCIVHIWDVEEEQIVHTMQLGTGDGSCGLSADTFRFSTDEKIMAGAVKETGDQVVRLWSVDGADELADLPVPERVRDLDFSPDGTLLAVASRLAVTIWDIPTKTLLHTLDQTFDSLASDSPVEVAFTPDGGHLAVARKDGTLELWRLPGADPIEAPPVDMHEPPPLPSDVLFDTGSAELKEDADAVLKELAEDLHNALPEAVITFIGHTDSRGDSDYNLQLSIDRASAVKDWFEDWAEVNVIDGWELLVDGRGDSELKVPDVNSEGTFLEDAGALNRRVEIEIDTIN